MSLAEQMIRNLQFEDSYLEATQQKSEEHIVVDESRRINIPASLKTIAVTGDRRVESVTFDCVRYWDEHDLSTFSIYINYILPNNKVSTYIPKSVWLDENDESVFHFEWEIWSVMTQYQGNITFGITAIQDGQPGRQWSSLPSKDFVVAQGVEVSFTPEEEIEAPTILQQMSEILAEMQSTADENATSIGENAKKIAQNSSEISRNSKRLTNIERGLPDEVFYEDNSVAVVKDVPSNALPYGGVFMLGGMTYRVNIGTEVAPEYVLRSAKVTRINSSAPIINSWAAVQRVVRSGKAREYFEIGDQLVCNKGDKQLVWDIIGFDHDVPADAQFKHSMTIQLHDLLPTAMQFDGTEALFYCETELAAGTYHFTLLAGYDTAYGGGKSYQFTLTKAVPAGGVIMFPWSKNEQASTVLVSTYESRTATTTIESVAVTEGTGGTALDTLGECNHTHRIRFGSNNWKQSAMRQFLNSKGAAGAFWTPQTKFDRPPTWNTSTAGFLSDLDEDFLEVVGEVTKRTGLNTVCDGGGYEDLTEKFFLISRSEAYAGNENGIEEGTPYEYYSLGSDLSAAGTGDDSNRIKYVGGSATYWCLRSSRSGSGTSVRMFSPSGVLSYNRYGAYLSYGVAPACNIV